VSHVTANSILDDVKKVLNIDPSYTAFDQDVILHINSVLSVLNQLGVGPEFGFSISDSTATWDSLIGSDARYNDVKTYVCLRVRVLFDPPQTAHHLTAFNEQIKEFEWRINAYREETGWVDPNPPTLPECSEDFVLDGGAP
jgi:hypothetical protein